MTKSRSDQQQLPMPEAALAEKWRQAAETSRQQFPHDHKRAAYYDEQARKYEQAR